MFVLSRTCPPETIYNVRTKIIAVDFTADESIYSKIKDKLAGLEIGTLSKAVYLLCNQTIDEILLHELFTVNNVGMGHPYPEM